MMLKLLKEIKNVFLGGSGTYFSIASSLYTKVHLVGVVGDDFDEHYIKMLNSKSISTKFLTRQKGETFHWGAFTVMILVLERHCSQNLVFLKILIHR